MIVCLCARGGAGIQLPTCKTVCRQLFHNGRNPKAKQKHSRTEARAETISQEVRNGYQAAVSSQFITALQSRLTTYRAYSYSIKVKRTRNPQKIRTEDTQQNPQRVRATANATPTRTTGGPCSFSPRAKSEKPARRKLSRTQRNSRDGKTLLTTYMLLCLRLFIVDALGLAQFA